MLEFQLPWDSQPQEIAGIDWSNPITRGLAFAVTPLGNLVGPPKGPTRPGISWIFDPAVPTPIDTGVAAPSVAEHSAVILARHPSMSGARNPQYLGTRVTGNNGWAFYQAAASGSAPTQLMGLGYVHGGVAAYTTATNIEDGNNKHLVLGFSAKVSTNITFYVGGVAHTTTAIGGINQTAATVRIGRDVWFSVQPGDYETPFVAYWNRMLSADEHRSIAENPWQLFAPQTIPVPVSAGGGGGSTLLPSSITSLEAFGTASISVGSVSVLVSGISSSEAFGTHVISNGSVIIIPSGISSLEAFGTAILDRGTVIVAPSGIASAEAFGTGSVLVGELVIYPNGISSAELFGIPTLTGGTPSTITSVFYVRGFSSFGFRRNS
jgi:hypothetical protein